MIYEPDGPLEALTFDSQLGSPSEACNTMTTVLVPIGLTSVLPNDTLHTKEANMTMVEEPEMLRPTSPAIASAMRVPSVDAEEDSAESNSSGSSSDEEEAAPIFEVSLDEDVDGSFSPRSPRRSSEPPMPAEFSITHPKLEETLSRRKTPGHWSERSSAQQDGAVKLPLSARSSRSPSVALRHEAALRSFNIRRLVSNTAPSTAEPSSAPATVADLKGFSEDGSEEGENDRDVRAYLDTVEQSGTAVFGEIEKEDEDEDAKFLPPRIEIEQDWNSDDDDEDEDEDEDAKFLPPRIEIEQDWTSDDDDEDVDTHSMPVSDAQQDASQRVRKQASIRMLNTLGRTPPTDLATATPSTATSTSSSGSQKLPKPIGLAARRSHHRLPSLDQIGSRSSVAKVGTPLPFNKTPMPQTPGTASLHQRAQSSPSSFLPSVNSTPSSASSSSISIDSGAPSSKAQSASATSTNWRRVPSAMLESGSQSTASTSSRRYVPPHLRGLQNELVAGASAPASRANFGAESVEQAVRAQPRDAVSHSLSSESGPVKAVNGARAAARTSMLAKLGQRSASPAPAPPAPSSAS
ncbi:hypothetical protein CBOM_05020 [Ceraceosorus bombacis]|uniref:Uncharacterized protein n=1 Tax=Ceraceosorus bombacis TaxID=401625 RepID=A0A0P1BJA0_9BASI|nr:hypothetical protein CBOM_05020 [Ceraceosorus bombacis]